MVTVGIENKANDQSNLLFTECNNFPYASRLTDSWNGAWVDYNNDGWEDLFLTDKKIDDANKLYRNTGTSFSPVSNNELVDVLAPSISSTWADIDNDGDMDAFLVNATNRRSSIYLNNGNGNFSELTNSGIDIQPQYFHGAAWFDQLGR